MAKHKTTIQAGLTQMLCGLLFTSLLTACVAPNTDPSATVSAMSDEAVMKIAGDIHRQTLILDAHADIVIPSTSKSYLAAGGVSKVAPGKLAEGGVDAVVMSVAVGPGPRTPAGDAAARAETDEKLTAIVTLVNNAPGDLVLARSSGDIAAAQKDGKTALILGFQNARSLEGKISALDRYYNAGVRVFGLNHLGHNDFSDSSRPLYDGETGPYEPTEEHGGLSELGEQAIVRINALGGVVDITQLSKAAALQTIALSKAPVIASHSNVRAISNVTRNLSDEEIDRIGETGGIIHIAAFGAYLVSFSDPEVLSDIRAVRRAAGLPEAYSYPYELYWELDTQEEKIAFLTSMRAVIGPGSVDDMIKHIDYVTDRIGVEHVGIGNDFNHGSGIDGFDDASDAHNVTIALLRAGYSPDDIGKIWGGNFLRVFAEAERLADRG